MVNIIHDFDIEFETYFPRMAMIAQMCYIRKTSFQIMEGKIGSETILYPKVILNKYPRVMQILISHQERF